MNEKKVSQPYSQDKLLSLIKSAANSIRFDIIWMLKDTKMNVTQIQERLKIKQPSVSRHLKILLDSGIICRLPHGNQNYYSLNPEPFELFQTYGRLILSEIRN